MPETLRNDGLPNSAEELVCFAIYSAGHALNRAYGPMLKKLNLTYPQYIALTVLWEHGELSVGDLCERLRLESNTITPLLKRLEILGYITRSRGKTDERQVFVSLTQHGRSLQAHAPAITKCIVDATGYNQKKLESLVKAISALRDNVINSGLKS